MTAPLRLFWWRWKYPDKLNFGDEISAPLIERITGRRVEWTPLEEADVLGAGSVIQMALRVRASSLPVIWGSGLIAPPRGGGHPLTPVPLAVRGQLTLGYVAPEQRAGVRLGDPGLLAPALLSRPVRRKYKVGVVPHYHDAKHPRVKALSKQSGVRLIDVAWSPEEVAREIASCDVVLSSSMHGLILADALAVPNLHVRFSEKLVGGTYKFRDYYSAFRSRDHVMVEEPGLPRIPATALVDFVLDRYQLPHGLDELQRGLIASIPV